MDKDIKDIMRRLGEAINESVQDSEKIQKLLREAEEGGYTFSLSLAVVVGLKSKDVSRRKTRPESNETREPGNSTAFDRRFLKALRIKFSEEQR